VSHPASDTALLTEVPGSALGKSPLAEVTKKSVEQGKGVLAEVVSELVVDNRVLVEVEVTERSTEKGMRLLGDVVSELVVDSRVLVEGEVTKYMARPYQYHGLL